MRHPSRRDFLRAVGAGSLLLAGGAAMSAPASRRLGPDEVKARIRGPILTVPTPFTADFAVDHAAVHRMVELALANKVGVYELTAGNSQYNVLSLEEIH